MSRTPTYRNFVSRSALCAVLVATPALAALDLRDYDDDLMRDLEKTIKYFEPDITARNAQAAKEDAEVLLDGFRYTEDYFAKKGKDDAVAISRDGSRLVADVVQNVEKGDFDAAAASAREATQVCKSCHEIYKPRLAR
ncbi:hypothetical protein [Methylosinus sp. Ce-a6]|uniref:hypothetical protein n=1 Tax=Methylosinus sp. Ce-a6 TaxID=2172005 RepID=UPI0013577F46|nr:hypothetical protein [Methylosinus sp. Ce-a6]